MKNQSELIFLASLTSDLTFHVKARAKDGASENKSVDFARVSAAVEHTLNLGSGIGAAFAERRVLAKRQAKAVTNR